MARKQKKHSGMAKRFKMSKNGKIRSKKSGYHHKNMKKRRKNVRQARKGTTLKDQKERNYQSWMSISGNN
ncbi:MAG: 50S ribosomal protein L35 [Candidatus Bipolaricaulia bacterium]